MGTGSGQDAAAYQVLRSPPILSDTVIGHNMEHTSLRVLASVVVAGLMVSGCNVYDASLVGSGLMTDGRPPRPTEPDDPTLNNELVFRINEVLLNSDVDWSSVGRNLDGFNTTIAATDQRQCDPPSGAAPPVDGPGGIDNAMGAQLLSIIELLINCLESELNNSHLVGEGTLMLWVQGWNGMKDDSVVSVSMLVAADGTSLDAADVEWDETTNQLVQLSDGVTPAAEPTGAPDDNYFIRPDSFSGGGTPVAILRDSNAYIADGTIVFVIPERGDIPLNAGIGSLTIRITDGLILADLSEDFTSITTGALSGRFSLGDLLNAGESIGVCPGPTQTNVEEQFQDLLDVKASAAAEPGGECDAMSLGIPFQAVRATIPRDGALPVRVSSNPPLPNACDRPNPDDPICPP